VEHCAGQLHVGVPADHSTAQGSTPKHTTGEHGTAGR
jgi:hypothetical protein